MSTSTSTRSVIAGCGWLAEAADAVGRQMNVGPVRMLTGNREELPSFPSSETLLENARGAYEVRHEVPRLENASSERGIDLKWERRIPMRILWMVALTVALCGCSSVLMNSQPE